MSSGSRKRKVELNLGQKFSVLTEIHKGRTQSEIGVEFGIDRCSVSRIKRDEQKILAAIENNENTCKKRDRKTSGEQVEEALFLWFTQMRARNVPLHGPMVLEKAHQISVQINSDFVPNPSWLERFKKRRNIIFHKLHGEKTSADDQSASKWLETAMPKILEDYSDETIYKADETALFYKALPTGTLSEKGGQNFGFKTNKDRLTCLFFMNKSGTDKNIFIIGKYPNPRCFRGKDPPISYFHNQKAWMTGVIWNQILSQFDRKLRAQNKRIMLLVDNASCHTAPENMSLTNISVKFFPPNVTSLIQPLDQGLIRAVKCHYRTQIIRQLVIHVDGGSEVADFAKKVDILKAMYLLRRAVFMLTPGSIQNCFRKAGFRSDIPENSQVQEVEELFDSPEEMNQEYFQNFVDADAAVPSSGDLTDNEICQEVQDQVEIVDEDDSDHDVAPMPMLSAAEALDMLEKLRVYFSGDVISQEKLDYLENSVETKRKRKQAKISDFFSA